MDLFPLTPGALERYRLAARKRAPAGQVGAHLLRRRGQSLEFRDHESYRPGDDFRHIDWRASARRRPSGTRASRTERLPQDLLVRRFEAEEELTLAISVDHRASMALLPEASKLRAACWLAYALAIVAASNGDRVVLHRLFGPSAGSVEPVAGKAALPRARRFLDALLDRPAADDTLPQLRTLDSHLPPAAVWLVLTDLYFRDPEARLARAVARAQRGMRWVIVADLDNWAHECVFLGLGARRIEGPGLGRGRLEVEVDDTRIEEVHRRIEEHKAAFFERTRRGGLSALHWRWPAARQVDLAELFVEFWNDEPVLRRLFRRRS